MGWRLGTNSGVWGAMMGLALGVKGRFGRKSWPWRRAARNWFCVLVMPFHSKFYKEMNTKSFEVGLIRWCFTATQHCHTAVHKSRSMSLARVRELIS